MPTVLLLGAASDIALAIARKFASNKYNVQLAARNSRRLAAACTDIGIRYGVQCTLHEFDALAPGMHAYFFESLTPRPDVTVCVFGSMEDEEAAFLDWKLTEKMIQTNYTGAVSILNTVARSYREKQTGVIVGISSVAGERGRQSKLIYGSTKAAFTAYLSGLRNKLARDGVHVLTVKPGFVFTKMTEGLNLPPLLTAQPAELGQAVWDAVRKRRNTIYVRWFWRYIMLIIKSIPEFQFKKMNL
jgi:short-subunit dehydrogenase